MSISTAANHAAERQGIVFDLSHSYLNAFRAAALRAGAVLADDDVKVLDRLVVLAGAADVSLRPHPAEIMRTVGEVMDLLDRSVAHDIERHSLYPHGLDRRPVPERALSARRRCIDTVRCALEAEWAAA